MLYIVYSYIFYIPTILEKYKKIYVYQTLNIFLAMDVMEIASC